MHGINEGRRRKAKWLVVTTCIGGGMGAAGLFELINNEPERRTFEDRPFSRTGGSFEPALGRGLWNSESA